MLSCIYSVPGEVPFQQEDMLQLRLSENLAQMGKSRLESAGLAYP